MRIRRTAGASAVLVLALLPAVPAAAAGAAGNEAPRTVRVSLASNGAQTEPGSISWSQSINGDGRYTAFSSSAANLVAEDTNTSDDVFVRDRVSRRTTRVSVAPDGTQGNGPSLETAISADGRYVAFASYATNLVPADTNGKADTFLHDRRTGETTRITAVGGTQPNEESRGPGLSADGRYLSFTSWATNLVPGDTNNRYDAFVHDRVTGRTTRVSVASDGTQGNHASDAAAISPTGRYVAFNSLASNLVPGDTNSPGPDALTDAFIHDRATGRTTRVSVASDGAQGDGGSWAAAVSANGQHVAFTSQATNLVPGDTNNRYDAFIHDRATGRTTRVSVASDGTQGNEDSSAGNLSSDGRHLTFSSAATNLVNGDTNATDDVFIRDQRHHRTTRLSASPAGAPGDGPSTEPEISADGRYVAYRSSATNLVRGDTNDAEDLFLVALAKR